MRGDGGEDLLRTLDLAELDWTVRLSSAPEACGAGAALSAHELAAVRAGIPARVPGNVHDDLLRAGIIPDPNRDDAVNGLAWIGESDWTYEALLPDGAVRAGGRERAELVFEGLQTVAVVEIDGVPVAHTENMHRRYGIDVTGLISPHGSRISVGFASTARVMREREAADPGGPLPYDWAYPYNRLRTMASSVGWDWAPPLVSAGIWRPARLEVWAGVRLRSHVRTSLAPDLTDGELIVDVKLAAAGDAVARDKVDIRLGDRTWTIPVDGATSVRLPVAAPELWHPRGHGDPVLHEVVISVVGTGTCERHRVAFRHVALDTTADEWGRRFGLVVNGIAVQARGANWIPQDLLMSRVDEQRCIALVGEAVAANMTMLRVWGGGVYEQDAFYRACDEAGLLVWQDFAFACAAYPEEEPLRAEVEAEAREQVRRLAAHPSVVLWNGSNECLQGWDDWGWREQVGTRTWGESYYRRLLPEIVAEEGCGTPYVPSSPFSSSPGVAPNADGEGTVHLWDQWNLLDHTTYRDHVPRFVAELGHQAPPAWATLRAALTRMPGRGDDPQLDHRQRQIGGMKHLVRRLDGHVPEPDALLDDLDDWLWATQLQQAEALRVAAEHLRGRWPRTTGLLVWQLGDAWPGISWSVVDHAGRRKPSWYALRRAFAPRAVSLQPIDGSPYVVLVNDTDEPWQAHVALRRVHVVDGELAAEPLEVTVPARDVVRRRLGAEVALPHRRREEVLVADVGELRATMVLCRPDGVRWAAPRPAVRAVRDADGWDVTVEADVLLADVSVMADRVAPAASADDQLRTLLPGETTTFRVLAGGSTSGADHTDPSAWSARPLLRTRNDLWHR